MYVTASGQMEMMRTITQSKIEDKYHGILRNYVIKQNQMVKHKYKVGNGENNVKLKKQRD